MKKNVSNSTSCNGWILLIQIHNKKNCLYISTVYKDAWMYISRWYDSCCEVVVYLVDEDGDDYNDDEMKMNKLTVKLFKENVR